ncbi:2-dehydro-3-deoxyphosphogluconate aldolase/4-hydroxy-2-oxoglutarate aldolase OS=Tsukamurella paurometabola(strain ATCC 8368 / DSM / CCUG 35730 / CIP 100753/ JCM 10117 / KCTC 9821 / NBRC 16120 / NCIMB 702349 / NCTC 13040) OX=521096 GN=Tpau_3005 PE=3 SV=1 [Tsukamurella paurometabola]|uniref:2-dehydro-3-deoxyphosphogluconate aldolase/4-hydroxy-2-oxoglutarate aldolase n=1 Tax=Tsukamurella paurometabola (strain ATCC 8368 / DSM 20162 / CCUG 35730 / CIP 100753 / JCM 10117 / KCTC 9821 / NBRC 16120 / NCIMB 702349 / NCTC 13040) TaxID=521096 RepID=D5UU97_TSUPD|nr:bifunctional 4-hydroxy-2-oxoglutarate aldolase/2-dehydro-3-deoxy-phosphogluconate aldolase [Tsukamurella paurometabola]ADG79600.1 2-dehydro-3-deoxyphosphogluconate aldolase/4- hydroxy-2-oxoglutarate aldolase [Tsukamurella paurometabola DSM 20162]SUP36392.1 2-dehydro-3-deoxy-phosphogluconate aldolase [Tsukamurella paurometabola]
MTTSLLDDLRADRVLTVVRAPDLPDAAALCRALAAGGIRTVELTFTTPGVLDHLERAATVVETCLGVGTVRTSAQARDAVNAGARFLVTPDVNEDVAQTARDFGIPVFLGALTPTEVARAAALGSVAVKIFPARAFGPGYLKDLHGPFPGLPLLPSGGVSESNAHEFLDAGAVAVCAGTSVVPPATVAAGDWADITTRAARFVAALG